MQIINNTLKSPQLKKNLAYILVCISQFLWPLSWIYNNENNINFSESAFCRGILFIFLNTTIVKMRGEALDFKDPISFRYIFIRALLMMFHVIMMALSQFILPLPIVHTINVSGIIFTFIIDYYLNSVMIVRKQFYGIMIALVGVCLTVNNQQIYKLFDPTHEFETSFQNYITQDPLIQKLTAFLLFINNISWGYAIVITKKIKFNTFQMNIILGIFNLYLGAIFLPILPSETQLQTLLKSILYSSLPLAIASLLFVGSFTLTKNSGTLTMFCVIPVGVGEILSAIKYKETQNPFIFIGISALVYGLFKTIINKQQ